jgi:protein-S-isoprenylcysteine O-methyltransferase Ste14
MSAGMSGTTEGFSWKDWIASCIYGSCMIIQMALTYFRYNSLGLDGLANTGWLVMAVSALFGWMPIYTLKKRGGVPEGEGYMKTTEIVETGVYSVVRHPQYLAGVLLSLSLVLISQYWINALLFLPVLVGTYIDSRRADRKLVDKFGEDYTKYMEKVPGLDPVTGSLRLLRRRG